MKKIDCENKLCLYFDQFVVSDLLMGKNPLWIEIKELLEFNYLNGKIYCPISVEHILETTKKNLEDAKVHDLYCRNISDGFSFKTEPHLTAQLISSLVRKNKKTTNIFLTKSTYKSMDDIYTLINSDHNIFDNGIRSCLQPQNDIRQILSNKIDKNLEIDMMNAIKQHEVDKFKLRLKEYIDLKSVTSRLDNFGELKVPNWIDQFLYQLTYKHKFKLRDFQSLFKELDKNGFSRIPTLNIKFSISAYLAVKNKKEDSGDHVDFMRISSYLFSSDIFFTDKQRKYEIQELELDKKYNTLVFTGVKNDLLKFIDLLKNL